MDNEMRMKLLALPAEIASARRQEIDAWQEWQKARLDARVREEAAKSDLEALIGVAILNGEIVGKNAEERAASRALWLKRNAPAAPTRQMQQTVIELEADYERAKAFRLYLQDEMAARLAFTAEQANQ